MTNQEKLDKLNIKIDEAIEWNFGRCPNESYFDNWLEERNELEKILEKEKSADLKSL